MTQDSLMMYDPADKSAMPYPSHASQYRQWHGPIAWLYNPWTGCNRDARDIGSDCFGYAINDCPEEMQQHTNLKVD